MLQSNPSISRHLRIFISSTFSDMKKEREILVKHVFPEIKKIARERFVEISEVDLRWGVTPEQSESGQALKICLDEIKKCKESPVFFIGILGERYGWVPDKLDATLFRDKEYKWLENYSDKSATEIEILYGVLNNPSQNHVSYFYFRDKMLSGEIEKQLGLGYEKNSIEVQKQEILKANIKSNKKVTIDGYKTIKEFGAYVIEDLKSELDRLYPLEDTPSTLDQERISHAHFAASRKKVYIPDATLDTEFDTFFQSSIPYLILHADSGMGKSALIAHSAERYRTENSDTFVIEHYIGGGGGNSSSLASLLLRIMNEIKEKYEITDELPSVDKLESEFGLWLYKIPKNTETVIFIDALNQLEELSVSRWIPHSLPSNVKIVFSSIEPINISSLLKTIAITPLSSKKQKEIITDYLSRFGKNLNNIQITKIISSIATQNPLYLKVLLDEIRVYGEYDNLDIELDRLLKHQEIDDLFEALLSRLENDYDKNGVLKEILSLIWCSNEGMNEDELLEMINGIDIEEYQDRVNELRITKMDFSHILLSLDEHFIDKEGRLNFFHGYLAKAVHNRYLQDEQDVRAFRMRIADYFQHGLDTGNKSISRVAIELPYQFYNINNYQKLLMTISNLDVFIEYIHHNSHQDNSLKLLKYYNAIKIVNKKEIFITNLLQKGFPENFEEFEKQMENIGKIVSFIMNYISYEIAATLYAQVLNEMETIFDDKHESILQLKNNLGLCLIKTGDYARALPLYNDIFETSKENFGEKDQRTLLYLTNLATCYGETGALNRAFPLYIQIYEFKKELFGEFSLDTIISMNNLGWLYSIAGQYEKAITIYKKTLNLILQKHGKNHPDTLKVLNGIALCYDEQNKHQEALPIHEEILMFKSELLGDSHESTLISVCNLAQCYSDIGEKDKALSLYKSAFEKVKDSAIISKDTIALQNNMANLFAELGETEKALLLFEDTLFVSKQHFGVKNMNTINVMNNLAYFYRKVGDLKKALNLFEELFILTDLTQ